MIGMASLNFEPKIDVGHFLTFITLTVGFLWWLYSSIRARREKSNEDARSGALRLILKILRDHSGPSIHIEQLHRQFHSPDMRDLRKAYCGRDYKFKSMPVFEAAIYRLDWEGKIAFPSSSEIAFRVDKHQGDAPKFVTTCSDRKKMLSILSDLLSRKEPTEWEIESVAETCLLVAPKETTDLLRNALNSPDPKLAQHVLSAMRRLVRVHANDSA
jgi:hypothetical protein